MCHIDDLQISAIEAAINGDKLRACNCMWALSAFLDVGHVIWHPCPQSPSSNQTGRGEPRRLGQGSPRRHYGTRAALGHCAVTWNSWCRWKQWDAKPVHSPPDARAVADVVCQTSQGQEPRGTHDTEQPSVETARERVLSPAHHPGVGLRRLSPTPTPVFEFRCAGLQCGYLARVVCAAGAVASSPFLFDGERPRPVSAP
ncbi:hypothetical protein QBC34DRAFT_396969 [Podospora aff. communis PSN243]|uniref:Uncharacterized protein n=1 Tax=Podospora aff. communis PSN243 TaxID=3040156 RepID=A0AAV9GV23_9PEZI|nr:hypothetical protein QBC34DRAFT_396969 [Podospora aff. communis PSN243]